MYELSLLIDDINETGTFAFTTNLERVERNCSLLGLHEDVGINSTLSTNGGITTVFATGRYVTILESNRLETDKKMWFFDIFASGDLRTFNQTILQGHFSERLINEFERVKSERLASFTDRDDLVELVIPASS